MVLQKGGRRRPLPPRYAVHLWNQYDPTREGKAKTKKESKGWHNRCRLLVNRAHLDLYTFIKELKKEQGDTEIAVVELSLGRKIKAAPKKNWVDIQDRLKTVANNYENYETYLEYLEAIQVCTSF